MAMIDHTTIVFKNGKLVTKLYEENDDGSFTWLLPFDYGRDGNIREINGICIEDQIKWHYDDYDVIYQRAGMRRMWCVTSIYAWIEWFKWKLHIMERFECTQRVGVYNVEDVHLYIYHQPLKQYYVSFYRDGVDSYVVLGGYGHHQNVYTHFYERGYGEEFELEMCLEAYRWCMDDVANHLVHAIVNADVYEMDASINNFKKMFGYKSYWDLDEEERKAYLAQDKIEVAE